MIDPTPRPCCNCGDVLVPGEGGHGRCRACYQYRYRTGRDRPAWLYDPRLRRPCANCGAGLIPGKTARGRGCCAACYLYWRRHGRERPVPQSA